MEILEGTNNYRSVHPWESASHSVQEEVYILTTETSIVRSATSHACQYVRRKFGCVRL